MYIPNICIRRQMTLCLREPLFTLLPAREPALIGRNERSFIFFSVLVRHMIRQITRLRLLNKNFNVQAVTSFITPHLEICFGDNHILNCYENYRINDTTGIYIYIYIYICPSGVRRGGGLWFEPPLPRTGKNVVEK